MAAATLFRRVSKSRNLNSVFDGLRNLATLAPKPFLNPSHLGRMISSPTVTFGQLGCEASLAANFPYQNHPIIGYPTPLLGGCFDQYTGETALVLIQGMSFPLLPVKITPEAREGDMHFTIQRNGSSDAKDVMGVKMFPHQSEELRKEELLVAPHKELSMSDECYAAALSSLVDAVLEYNYFTMGIRCATKKIKFAKWRKGRMGGISHRGNVISFGNYALQVLDNAWITAKQLEAGRRALSRIVGRGAKIWVRAITDKPVTERPAETRMGRGKGAVSYFVAVVQPGRILYEISGVTESIARKAVDVAASKLPVATRFIITS